MNSRFVYLTSYFNISTWISNRHLKLSMSNIEFLVIFPQIYLVNYFHLSSCTGRKPSPTLVYARKCQNPTSLSLYCFLSGKNYCHLLFELLHSLLIGGPASTHHPTISAQEICQNDAFKTYQITRILFLLPCNGSFLQSQSLYNDL